MGLRDEVTGVNKREPLLRERGVSSDTVSSEVEELIGAARPQDAKSLIEKAVAREPARESYRRLALRVCAEAGQWEDVRQHTEWLMTYYTDSRALAAICEIYHFLARRDRAGLLSDRMLGHAVVAANACGDSGMVVDATKRLMKDHPKSPHLPQALLVTARHQLSEGRHELARATLTYVAEGFGENAASQHARRMLANFAALMKVSGER
jgi:hypothetical protein